MTLRQMINAAAIAGVMVMAPTAWAAQQQAAPQMAGVAQAAVAGCAQAHPMAERTIDMMNRRLEAARQANSPAAMRAATDDLQIALRQLRTDIAPCAGVQSLAAADPHTDHVIPDAPQTPAAAPQPTAAAAAPLVIPAQRPAGPLRTPTTQPRTMPLPATAADPRAGHVMPAAPQATEAAPEASAVRAMTTGENPASRLADLMCQPQVDPETAPRATYMGKAYYFCTAADRDLFLKAPAKYL